jgi:hypothetical protein
MKLVNLLILFFLPCEEIEFSEALNDKLTFNQQNEQIKVCYYFDESTEGGEVRGYYEKGELKKIEVTLYAEIGKTYKEFILKTTGISYDFKQIYYFYDKPFYFVDFIVIDSFIMSGQYNNGTLLPNPSIGKKPDILNINMEFSEIDKNKKMFELFIDSCNAN